MSVRWTLPSFRGNPYVTITAIDTSGGIVMQRSSGQIPAFVQVSISAFTATGTSRPYKDVECRWDFGDPGSTETFTDPQGNVINSNNGQVGTEAVHCYRTAGVKTITATIRGKNGGAFTTATKTATFTVTAFNVGGGEYWFDQVAGNDANSGTDINNPKQSMSALQGLMLDSPDNRAYNLKCGSNWDGTLGIILNDHVASKFRLRSYGSGAKPIIRVTGGGLAMSLDNGDGARDDIVFSNLDIRQGGAATCCVMRAARNSVNTVNNAFFDNIDMTVEISGGADCLNCDGAGAGGARMMTGFGLWNCNLKGPLTSSISRGGVYGMGSDWSFFVGGSVSGAGHDNTRDHHIYPHNTTHALYAYITFSSPNGGNLLNYCINTDCSIAVGSSPGYCDFINIRDNTMTGTLRAFDGSNSDNDPSISRFRNFVAEGNAIHDLGGNATFGYYCLEDLTFRWNAMWNCDQGDAYTPTAAQTPFLVGHIYGNVVFRQSGIGFGNFINAASRAYPNAQIFAGNTIYDTQAAAKIFDIDWTANASAGSLINFNQYYFPNDSDAKALSDNSTLKTFAAWQAAGFDVNGSVANPDWVDPVNGNFGVATTIASHHHRLSIGIGIGI